MKKNLGTFWGRSRTGCPESCGVLVAAGRRKPGVVEGEIQGSRERGQIRSILGGVHMKPTKVEKGNIGGGRANYQA